MFCPCAGQPRTTDKEISMELKSRIFRGVGVVAAFLCALCLGGEAIAASGDYKSMVDSMLGGTGGKVGSSETYAYTSDYDSLQQMLTERVKVAEQIAEEGSVLLKNSGALPLRKAGGMEELKVTMLGNRAYTYTSNDVLRDTNLTFYGGITGSKIYRQTVTTEEGVTDCPVTMEDALAGQNIIINPALENYYSGQSYTPHPQGSEAADAGGGAYAVEEPSVQLENCGDYEDYSDACIVVIGRTSGEGRDYLPGAVGVKEGSGQTSAIGLSDDELHLIEVADQIAHGNVVVVINSAVAMDISELSRDDRVNSVLWIGLPGSYGLNGVARVLSGEAAPSGHLPDTYAVSAAAAPASINFGTGSQDGSGQFTWADGSHGYASNSHYVVMAEGIYTGYYYYETRYADSILRPESGASSLTEDGRDAASPDAEAWNYADEVVYPFGYGLSYTTFSQEIVPDSFVFDATANTVSVDVTVTNTGSVPAKSVVQLYVQSPYTEYDMSAGVEKPAIQLLTFGKTDIVQPGEENAVTLTLTGDVKYIASYDKTYSHDGVTGGYIMEEGEYRFAIGNGAHAALNNILANCDGVEQDRLALCGEQINPSGTCVWDTAAESAFSFDGDGVDGAYFAQAESGVTVQNRLADADYNYFETGETVTYLSRRDWTGTFPEAYTSLPTSGEMDDLLDTSGKSVYRITPGGNTEVQFGVDHAEEMDENGDPLANTDIASYKGIPFEGTADRDWDFLLEQITFEEAWQFAPLGGTSCKPFTSVNAPEVWQIDGPNGNVTRQYTVNAPASGVMAVPDNDPNAGNYSADMPAEPVTAATFNRELVERQGEMYGEDTLWSRNPIMWAPGMNLHRTQFNSRNHEYYSEDPMLTNILGTSFVRGGLKKGAILSAKHFAFNTQESFREGLAQFFEEQSGRELELRAFQGLFEDVEYVDASGNTLNALGLMTTFSRIGATGANAHTGMMKNILREEWDFNGLSSTDMVSNVDFFNPTDCVINNVTFMATSSGESFLSNDKWSPYNNMASVQADANMVNALYENMHYYMYAIANSSALNGYAPGDTIDVSMSWWQYMLLGLAGGMGAVALASAALCAVFEVKGRKRRNGGEGDVEG